MAEDWARPVVFWEIQARDGAALSAFYKELFNWEGNGDGANIRFAPGIGGPLPGPGGMVRTAGNSGVSLYIQVRDLRESLAKGATLGGKVISEPFDPPGGGATLAGLLDPEGNRLMLVQQ
jgi:predicted enzyme related to lactoylglutathione lyase